MDPVATFWDNHVNGGLGVTFGTPIHHAPERLLNASLTGPNLTRNRFKHRIEMCAAAPRTLHAVSLGTCRTRGLVTHVYLQLALGAFKIREMEDAHPAHSVITTTVVSFVPLA